MRALNSYIYMFASKAKTGNKFKNLKYKSRINYIKINNFATCLKPDTIHHLYLTYFCGNFF